MSKLILYHGSSIILEEPEFGKGKAYNDYGLGFYCTESEGLAKEWACTSESSGFANQYLLDTSSLSIFNLSEKNILNWLAVLIENRTFKIKSDLAEQARQYLKHEFAIDISSYDVIIGYRADDSYFSFAESFLNGALSLENLSHAMKLGNLGTQVVLKSKKAFECLEFKGYETANHDIYFSKRDERDAGARAEYQRIRKSSNPLDGTYIIDILREEWKNDDPRL